MDMMRSVDERGCVHRVAHIGKLQIGGFTVFHRILLAILCPAIAMPMPAAWAQVPAKSAMTVGAIVVKPCLISDRDSKNICHTNIRKKVSENVSQLVVADTYSYDQASASRNTVVEYEF